jgi:hypothetical protein
MLIPPQPALPAEGPYNDTEQLFIEESPIGLWPENQDSNFGQVRRVVTQPLQDAVDLVTELFNERFTDTATGYLGRWEQELGVPKQSTKTAEQRRAYLEGRMKKGSFTRARRNEIIESFIKVTFGESIALLPDGVDLVAGGVPLFADTASVDTLYRVYEDIMNFSWELWIVNTVTPDIAGLTRELNHYDPAGYPFTIDNTKANILDYFRLARNYGPSGYWRLATNFNDSSGLGHTATANGGVTAGSGASLVLNSDANGANFDGTDDYLSISDSAPLSSEIFTINAWVKTDTLPSVSNYRRIYSSGQMFLAIANLSGTGVKATASIGNQAGDFLDIYGTTEIQTATTYMITATYDGRRLRIYVNGQEELSTGFSSPVKPLGEFNDRAWLNGNKRIASSLTPSMFWDGILDEVAFYGYALSASDILKLYKTGTNVL